MNHPAKSFNKTHWIAFAVTGFILLFVLPPVLSVFQLNLLGKFLTYAIVAVGLDMIWGYAGMLSLGQGLFFGLGAYCFGMYLNLEAAGERLPNFMSLYGVFELPWFWEPFRSPVIALFLAVALPMVLAGVLGYMLFRSRIQGVYFAIVTQALTAIVALLLVGQQQAINGTNGITEMKTIFGFTIGDNSTQTGLYIATVIVLGLVYIFCRMTIKSRFGRLMIAIRDDEQRLRFIGYNPALIKAIVFALSAGIAGLAGVLFVPQVGIISPKQLDILASIEIVIWVAVGGRATLIGAIVGALLVNTGKSTISTANPDLWQLIMGALFVGVVLLFPKGLVGTLQSLYTRLSSRIRRTPLNHPGTAVAAADLEIDTAR
ncbi:MAG: urea ABC transporter permease subunit UrtC [Anaerolineaceae bacterium]|nr:urea ABC transporter permease subunit UrtC [Anaerolineaceae bacterium]